MKWKSLFAAALSAVVAWPALAQSSTGGGIPSGRVISVNFAGANSGDLSGPLTDTEETFGLVPVPGSAWVDCHGATTSSEAGISGTQEITSAYGSEETFAAATLTYSAKNMYGLATNSGILKTWLGDGTGAQISVTNIPFENYAVIVYFATNNGDSFKPVTVNNNKYIGTAAGSEEVTDTGNATWGSPQPSDIALGTNALRVNGLSGDLSIVGASSDGTGGARGCIAGFQIVEVFPSISVNFAGDASGTHSVPIPETSEAYGLFPVPGSEWENGFTGSGTIQVSSAYGSSETFLSTLSYKSKNIWHNTDSYDTLLQTYLDDGTDTTNNISGASISMDNVPFTEYAVIVYCAGGNSAFLPVTVNGKTYTWSDTDNATVEVEGEGSANFGSSSVTTPTLGKNALCVTGLTDAALTVQGQSGGENTARGGIAAIQIICTGEVIVPPPPTINVNFASGRVNAGNTTFDKALTGDTPYGLEPVPGDEWVNLYVSDRTQDVPLALYNGESPLVPSVNYNASGMWSYEGVSGINDLLVAALDDASAVSDANNATITVTDVPFTQYDVIVYLQAEGQGGGFKPVEVNGSYYSWQNGATQAVTDSSDTYAWGTLSQPQPVLGVNALRIAGQTARELTINAPVRTGGPDDSKRCNLTGFQIVCTGEVIEDFLDPAKEGVISLNFGSNQCAVPENETAYGLVPVAGNKWQNFSDESGTDVAITRAENTDLADAPTVTYNADVTYATSANVTHPFLQGYLDDGATSNGYGATISVANLPYSAYDVIVYAGYADSDADNIQPYEIDDTFYRWDDTKQTTVATTDTSAAASWGSRSATPAYGENALRVRGRLASTLLPLTVKGLPRNGDERGGIAALQIVERKLITKDFANALDALADDTPVYLMPTASITGDLTLPADAVLDLRYVTWDNPVVSGTLTLGANTMIRLPSGRVEYAVAGTLDDETDSVQVFVHDDISDSVGQLADGVTISGGTITRPVTYEWTGKGSDTNWTTAANWIDGEVPKADSEVTIPLADGARKTITLTEGAVAGSLTITGPASGTATLDIEGAENGSLTIAGQMATSGNVTVTQNANITVNGKSTMVFPSGAPQAYPYPGAFHVEGAGAKYNVVGGTLSVPKVPEMASGTDIEKTAGGFVTVCGGASLSVGGGDAEAVLSVYRCSMSWPSEGVSRDGTVTVRPRGVLEVAYQSNFASGLTLVTEGGTIRAKSGSVTVSYRGGYAPTSSLTLSAPEGATLTLSAQSSTNALLTGDAPVIIDGPGTVAFVGTIDPATYTGEISVTNGTLSIGERRPKLSVVSGTTVLITPTTDELAVGSISFATSMTEEPTGDTFTVSGVEEEITPSVEDGVLTLKWESAMPTLATTGDWSTANWTNLATGQTAPTSGVVVLDGTAEGGITVTLDTALTDMESILVLGDVTLKTTTTQTSIPTCVTPAEGATLTVGAVQFASGWTLPSGATLKVTDTTTSLFGVTLNGVVELAFSGTTETPATYSAPASFLGGLTVSGSDVSITDVRLLGDAVTHLTGDNVSLTFSGTSFYTRTTLINEGTGNKLLNIQNLNGEILANAGTLALEVALVRNEETSTEENPVYVQNVAPEFKGLTIAEGATVTFTGVGTGGQFAVTGAGTLDMGTFRKQLAGRDGTLVKNLCVTATDDEQKAGEIRFLVQGSPALPDGFQVVVTPAEGAAAWKPTWGLNGQNLVITNVPPTPVMSVTGNWSAGPWSTGTVPTTGEVILDGGSAGIVVTMDTALDAAIAVTVRGAVTLKTSATQTTLPDNITLEEGASLGVEYAAATTDDISDLAITRGLAITGDNVTVTAGTISGGSVTLSGGQASLTVATLAKGVNVTSAAANVSLTVTDHFGEIGATTGNPTITVATATFSDLTLNTCRGLGGVRIEADASLRLASTWAAGQELHATGDGYLDMTLVAAENRPTLARWGSTLTTLPKTIQVTASEAENTAGKVELDLVVPSGNNDTAYVTLPEGFVAQVTYGLAHWEVASTVISEDHSKLVITKAAPDVSPSLPEGSTLSEAATAALNTAAEKAGITGEYAVAITTGDATVQVTTAEAATQLQEVLECFTDLTLKATTEGGNTVTVVYDFGVVGIKRDTDGWVVTAKVQGENAAAGFAKGNYYALTVKVPGETGSERIVNVTPVDEANIGSGTVELTVPDTALEGVDDGFTVGVSVSRTAQQL